jgi:hypothetical protein
MEKKLIMECDSCGAHIYTEESFISFDKNVEKLEWDEKDQSASSYVDSTVCLLSICEKCAANLNDEKLEMIADYTLKMLRKDLGK